MSDTSVTTGLQLGAQRRFMRWSMPDHQHTSLLAAARDWTTAGYRVHRCYPDTDHERGKKPIGKWKDLWNQPRTDRELDAMFDPGGFHDKSRLMTIIVPQGMIVFDFDHKPADGYDATETLSAFCACFDLQTDKDGLPDCPVIRTPSGGLHLYYTLPVGFIAPNWVKSPHFPVPGIDLRTSGKGIALIPPSVRSDGGRYEWAKWMREVPPCTDDMVDALIPPERHIPEVTGERRPYKPSASGMHPYVSAAFEGALADLDATGKGGRNNAFFVATRKVAQYVAGGEISEAEALSALRGSRIYGELLREDGRGSIEATMKSGWHAGMAEPKNAPPPDPDFVLNRLLEEQGLQRVSDADNLALDAAMRQRQAVIDDLRDRQEDRRLNNAQETEEYEDDEEDADWRPDWLVDWEDEGEPVDGTRAAVLLGSMVDRDISAQSFRVRRWRVDGVIQPGLILMLAFRDPSAFHAPDPAEAPILGLQEVWLPETGEIGVSRPRGRPFNGICVFRKGRSNAVLLSDDLGKLVDAWKGVREHDAALRGNGLIARTAAPGDIDVAMVYDASALSSAALTNLADTILLVLDRTPENQLLADDASANLSQQGRSLILLWCVEDAS